MTAPADTELHQQILEAIRTLLPGVLKREIPDVPDEAQLMADLGLTSSTLLELLLQLEEVLDVQIDVEEIDGDNAGTVATLATYVAGHLQSDG